MKHNPSNFLSFAKTLSIASHFLLTAYTLQKQREVIIETPHEERFVELPSLQDCFANISAY